MPTFTHAVATDNYGPAKFIVSTNAYEGTHTTLASALAAASSGDTVFLRTSVTENVTIPAGVNIAAWTGGTANTPSITGTVTMTAAGTCNISCIELITNSANCLTVSGSAASIVNLFECYINCTNNTGISFSSSSSSAQINLYQCTGNLGTTGIGFHSSSSAGNIVYNSCTFTNTGGSTTASSNSAGYCDLNFCQCPCAFSTSSTGNIIALWTEINPTNTTAITTAGTGNNSGAHYCLLQSGTASAVSIGSGTVFTSFYSEFGSSNTNVITGAGILNYGCLEFNQAGVTVNTTTQTAQTVAVGALKFLPATGTTGTATTNIMQFYEEGTFTPTIDGTVSGTTTYTSQNGYYTKIGNMVTIWVRMIITAATGTGNATLGGFPFTIKNQSNGTPVGTLFLSSNTWSWTGNSIIVLGNINSTTAIMQGQSSAGGNTAIPMHNGAATFAFTMSYQV